MSSSSSATFQSFARDMDDENRGIPLHCRCGVRVVRRTSKTTKNPGRLFHSCPKASESEGFHTFKWTDEAVVEEIEDIRIVISNCEAMVKCNEKEILEVKAKLNEFENVIEGIKVEVNRMKLIFVAGFVFLGCVYWLST